MIGDWNGKVGSQEIPGVSGKFGLKIQNETGQRLTEFCLVCGAFYQAWEEGDVCGYQGFVIPSPFFFFLV